MKRTNSRTCGTCGDHASAERKRPSASTTVEQAIIVYDLRPVPHWPKYWIQALAKHFQRQLKPSPKIDISLLDDRIRFSVFVSTDVSAKDLCKLD